ncbi:hypothetical protein LOK49_LG11G01435 [Camellia lanceoleosa]|uniref:Uncharacterized protein n=1 Tax=Camellia lanceoleosa TaxID=1840588 RepID=A0ACC0G0M8_9ERIC|nr:hypothetical protein LOK49_LG11G01435 [Camellia lanceoleosa]
MMTDDWVTAALADDSVVVELLFRLKHSSESLAPVPPMLRWGQRQPRSKPALASEKKERESTRCSPTTPLSWSCGGAASPSDGCDESSRRSDRSSGGRSKGIFTNETTATATTNKRSRRKKVVFLGNTRKRTQFRSNFTSLYYIIILKMQRGDFASEGEDEFVKELATLRETLEEQKAKSQNLKRLKLDLYSQSANKLAATCNVLEAPNSSQPNLAEVSTLDHVSVLPTITSASCKVENKEVETSERCFVLPDLNMMPSEEDSVSGCVTLYGLS